MKSAPRSLPAATTRRRVPPLDWMAAHVRLFLWINWVVESLIVATGGIVRLSASGLGCPTWPACVDGSLAPTPDQAEGIHSAIEFGNRTLTGLVGLAALAVVVAVWWHWPHRRGLVLLAVSVVVGVLLQAVIGGFSVLTGLNPWLVATHFWVSMALVTVSTLLLHRSTVIAGPRPVRAIRAIAGVSAAAGAMSIFAGTVVTGSGPHSGDSEAAPRMGFSLRVVSWLHADVVMLFLGFVAGTLVALVASHANRSQRRWWLITLLLILAQGLLGYVQYYTGLPEGLVLAHMVGATLLTASLTVAVSTLIPNTTPDTATPPDTAAAPAS